MTVQLEFNALIRTFAQTAASRPDGHPDTIEILAQAINHDYESAVCWLIKEAVAPQATVKREDGSEGCTLHGLIVAYGLSEGAAEKVLSRARRHHILSRNLYGNQYIFMAATLA